MSRRVHPPHGSPRPLSHAISRAHATPPTVPDVSPLCTAPSVTAETITDDELRALAVDRATLERLRAHAASAARLIGHIDALATGPLADHVDALAHELGELLGNPHLIAVPVPSARSSFALDGVPELVAPDAPTASRTLIADNRMLLEPRRCT